MKEALIAPPGSDAHAVDVPELVAAGKLSLTFVLGLARGGTTAIEKHLHRALKYDANGNGRIERRELARLMRDLRLERLDCSPLCDRSLTRCG